MRSIYVCDISDSISKVYSSELQAQLRQEAGLEGIFSKSMILMQRSSFTDVEYIFSTWGMPCFSEEEIREIFPKLKCIFYAAGTVQAFARPFLRCGVKVFSAWAANAVPVAEYTVAQIVLANKGFYHTARLMSHGDYSAAVSDRVHYPGNYNTSVGLIGVGQISRLVIQMLKNYKIRVKVCSQSLSEEGARALGVKRCSLEEIFATCEVVSNHLANNASTQGRLQARHFASMLPWATFLNTGRGAQVVEADLAQVLEDRPDLTAILDVTWPEPPLENSPFYKLPNCILTPHIAGSSGNELCRMAEYMVQEFKNYLSGNYCTYEVTEEMLKTMA